MEQSTRKKTAGERESEREKRETPEIHKTLPLSLLALY